ncbi:hypothetical protein J7J90_03620 [Candidatus Micrarchaeota archaeon]|nr:hypothetical protein [Candidatus Micrarchaeota archaeon]
MVKNNNSIDDLLISTSVDNLIKLVHEKKRISIEEAANILNLPFKTIEDWGKELEKQGLIKIEYKFTTEILIWVGGEEEIVEKIGDIETQKKFSEEKLGQLMTKIKVANAELELLKQQYTKSINDVGPIVDETNKKIASLSEAISSSEKLYHRNMQRINKLSGNYKKIKTELDGIRKELEQFKKDIQKLPGKTSVQKLLKNFESKLKQQQIVIDKKLKDLDDKINDYKQKLKTIQKINNKIDIVSSELRKDEKMHEEFGNMIDNIEKSYRKFNMISNRISGGMPFDRKMQLYHSKFKEINRDLDNIEKRIEMLRAEVGEESTAADDVYRMYKKLSKINFDNLLKSFKDKEKMLNAELEKIRQLFKEVESSKEILKNVNDTMKEISNAEAMVDKERVKMSDKLSSMSDELKDEIRGLSVYETKMNNLSNRINMLLDKIDKHANEYEKNMKRYKTEKENFQKNFNVQKSDILKHIKKLEEWNKKYKEVFSKKTMLSKVSTTIKSIQEDITTLEKGLSVIQKKIDLLTELKGRPEEQYAVLEFIKQKLKESKEKEAEVEEKREKLKKLIEKMWHETNPG